MGPRDGVFQEASGVRQRPNLNRRPGERRERRHCSAAVVIRQISGRSLDNSFLCVRRDDAVVRPYRLTPSHHGQVPDISV